MHIRSWLSPLWSVTLYWFLKPKFKFSEAILPSIFDAVCLNIQHPLQPRAGAESFFAYLTLHCHVLFSFTFTFQCFPVLSSSLPSSPLLSFLLLSPCAPCVLHPLMVISLPPWSLWHSRHVLPGPLPYLMVKRGSKRREKGGERERLRGGTVRWRVRVQHVVAIGAIFNLTSWWIFLEKGMRRWNARSGEKKRE